MTAQTRWTRRNLFRGGMVAGGALMVPGLLSACSKTGESIEDKTKDGGKFRIAYADEVPFAYTDDNGKAIGQSINVYTEILHNLGYTDDQMEFKLIEWGKLIPGLGSTHEMVVAGMFITPERCGNAIFANPDYVMPDALMVAKGNPKGLTDLNSFIEGDAVLGVMNGTSELEYATALGIPEDRTNVQDALPQLMKELKAGALDGIALTAVNLEIQAESDPEVEVTEPFIPVIDGEEKIGAGAAVFQSSDIELRDKCNEELAKILADKQKWLSLVEEFNFTEDYFPPADMTAQSICGDAYQ